MIPLTWPEFSNMHPFAPVDQAQGYTKIMEVAHSFPHSLVLSLTPGNECRNFRGIFRR